MENKRVIKIHTVFWIVISCITFFHVLAFLGNPLLIPIIISIPIRIFFNIITFYVFYFLISDKYFNKKGLTILILFGLIYLAVTCFISTFIVFLPYAFTRSPENPFQYTLEKGIKNNIYIAMAYTVIFSILGSMAKISLIWYRNQLKRKEIEKQNISNELAMLKVQVNPHFLFNTMNNIKSLIKSRPPEAVKSIDKLSGIMHYMIFDSSCDSVPLEDEITHINNYLELERIRFSEPDFIKFEINGDYSNVMVPPLIFMPFIENAFKHGNRLAPAPGIVIIIKIKGSEILFESLNQLKENREMQNNRSGFGLSSVRRRLDLLFGNKYNLEIENRNKIYSVKLNLNLS